MLQILIQSINPSTQVGVVEYKLVIERARMPKYKENVIHMLDDMDDNYQHILELGGKHDDYLMHLFNALLSAKNETFCRFIQRKKDDWETEDNITADALVEFAKMKYNNMTKQKL